MPARSSSGPSASRMRPLGTATISGLSVLPRSSGLALDAGGVGADGRELALHVLVAAVEVVDARARRSRPRPSTSPAITSEALARRSVAITLAPESGLPPLTWAVWPSTSISAPMRASSGTCMKRFSKIFSSMRDTPLGERHQHHELRLHVGGEAGVRGGGDVDRAERRVRPAGDAHGVALAADLHARLRAAWRPPPRGPRAARPRGARRRPAAAAATM